jgi:hypothetical protein
MGRPIKKKFFGNLNLPKYGSVGQGSGVGGEAVASISFSNTGTAQYSTGTTITISAPNITGGVRATATPTFNASGQFTGAVITDGGSGYTTATTVTITTATGVASTVNSGTTNTYVINVSDATGIKLGMLIWGASTGAGGRVVNITGNAVTSNVLNSASWTNASNLKFYDTGAGGAATGVLAVGQRQDAIQFTAYLLAKDGGSSAINGGDIIKQEASHRYLVQNAQGVGQCKLVATNSPTAGQMYIVATDANGSTYWVTKLTAHKVRLKQRTMSTAYLIADGAQTGWNIGAPSGTIVTLSNTN